MSAIRKRPTGAGRRTRTTCALAAQLAVLVALLAAAAPSLAHHGGEHFGDNYDIADINTADSQTVPAFPGTKAFWAGTCDLGAAPALGDPIGGDGVGTRPEKISLDRPASGSHPQAGPYHESDVFLEGLYFTHPFIGTVEIYPPGTKLWDAPVDAPADPPHCVDYGVPNDSTGNQKSPPTGDSWEPTPNDPEGWWTDDAGESPFEPSWRLPAVTQAGGHPDGTASFAFKRNGGPVLGTVGPGGAPDNVGVALPAGFAGNPLAVPKCTAEQFAVKPSRCPPQSQVGLATISLTSPPTAGVATDYYPVYNLEPREGYTAELGIPDVKRYTSVRVVAKARTGSDFGVTGWAVQVPAVLPVFQQALTLWGVPWAPEHDLWRPREGFRLGDIPQTGVPAAERASYDPTWGDVRPFLSNITGAVDPAGPCDETGAQPNTLLTADTFQNPGAFTSYGEPDLSDDNWATADSPAPAIVGCEAPGFEPDMQLAPTTALADGPTGLDVDLALPQNNDPKTAGGAPLEPPAAGASQSEIDAYLDDALAFWRSPEGSASSHLKDTVVTLPEGVSVNPAGATGLEACADAVVGVRQGGDPPLFNNVDPFDGVGVECPDGSKIGTVEVDTPLLEETLHGDVILGEPKSTDPTSGEMFRLFLLVRSKSRDLVAKIYGSTVADPNTGQLTATFANNPQLPVDEVRVDIKGGERATLAMGQRCGTHGWSSSFTGWARPGEAVPDGGAFTANANCAFGFSPTFAAGMRGRQGGGSGTFALRFARDDGEQWLRGVQATLPAGLLAAVRHVQLCTDAQAAANACPLASQIGTADAGAGSGTPFFLERPGRVYLTEGYKGAPYGLAVSIPVEAGPFRGNMALEPIVVRQALHVDPHTAQATAVSDPFPQVWHGIPLRARQVTVRVDRNGFMRNPTDCTPKQIRATLRSAQGAAAAVAARFQAAGCADLGFKPRLALALKGRRQAKTGGHPAVRALVRQGAGEAGIENARVTLPRSLALDPANAQALCEFADGTKADPENHCPRGSIVGRARAVSPLLKRPLSGPVFFVKNIRTDPDTGNQIRTLPMLIVALRGEIAINLRGESDVDKRSRLVNTFANVPDAPVSRFAMRIQGARNGILTVTRTQAGNISLCSGRQIARANMDGHNGRQHNRRIRINTPCAKRRAPAAKVCRKRTNNRKADRRCVRNVKQARAKRRAAARRNRG